MALEAIVEMLINVYRVRDIFVIFFYNYCIIYRRKIWRFYPVQTHFAINGTLAKVGIAGYNLQLQFLLCSFTQNLQKVGYS